ncbi:hypothetical protein FG064_19100 [Vibrio cholerae]|uniref:hypothetical protein n=1 Tax=Vibrio cholerae TaxID=666 RepID=UPI0011D45A61|nr:hypothetical protein [Vibrio cholerae]EGQ8581729.1 hypothetical protein [Vibrio cholerae]EGR0469063.1 hypothetical protein [Vibrio cholerae]EGR2527689.1 hypothetical protein [Vibrio cholerae]TXZ67119.1 hypothetical protein FXE27_13990 [Vibrio cholerae]GIB66573.1 hypothetical protein VCSRO47_3497 [Vibrio cholerae]
MNGIEQLSDIERLKILKSIRLGCSTDSEFKPYLENYAGSLGVTEANRRVDGLLLEDEFLLLCKLMKSCFVINGLDQGLTIENNLKVPDYLAVFDTRNCIYDSESILEKLSAFVEVKTTDNAETKKLGAGFFKKYSNYADTFGIPLLIASRLKINAQQQWWIIQTQEQFQNHGRKASVECLTNSVGHILLNDCFITATQNIYVEKTFSKSPSISKVYDPAYGYLKSVTVKTDESAIVLEERDFLFNLFLDCFAQKQLPIRQHGEEVILTGVIDFMQNQLLSDMLLRANFCILDGHGHRYSSASRLLALVESGNATILYRDFIEHSLNFFNSDNFLFMVTKIGKEKTNQDIVSSLAVDG